MKNGTVLVTSVAIRAFKDCTELTSVVLPNSVTKIVYEAFYGCKSLEKVDLGDGLEEISSHISYKGTFEGCSSLKSITIPDKVESIPDNCFAYCNSLENADLGDGLRSLGRSAFKECERLKSITIPNKVESIDDNCFAYCSSLEKVVLGDHLKDIDYEVFYNCLNISEITSLNPTPPDMFYNTFSKNVLENATVRVPVGCGDAYRADLYWRKFANIVETDFGGVDEVASDDVSVTVNGGSIEIVGEGNALVEVYNLSGQLVYSGMETTIGGIARGIYIVRVAGQTFKVAL